MTTLQRIAQVFGWIFVVIAIWGALITGTSMEADPAAAHRLWGIFPLNFVHNLVHLGLGLWGIAASRSHGAARSYAVWAGVIYIALAVLGLFFPRGLGLVPLGGNDIWLHAFLGVVLLGAGLTLASGAGSGTVEPASTRTVMPPPAEPGPEPRPAEPPRTEPRPEPRPGGTEREPPAGGTDRPAHPGPGPDADAGSDAPR